MLTDTISDLLFITEQSGYDNLIGEGVPAEKIHFVGNVMIDTLMANREKAKNSDILSRMNLDPKSYAVITLHRPSNVDNLEMFERIISAFEQIQKDIKLIFPIHPRTLNNIKGTELDSRVKAMENLILLEPVGYLDFLWLMSNAALVMTDSGGIQEETTILGVPCMTLRENTERPVTIDQGTNRLVHITTEDILKNYRDICNNTNHDNAGVPELWDGKAAERIAQIIANH